MPAFVLRAAATQLESSPIPATSPRPPCALMRLSLIAITSFVFDLVHVLPMSHCATHRALPPSAARRRGHLRPIQIPVEQASSTSSSSSSSLSYPWPYPILSLALLRHVQRSAEARRSWTHSLHPHLPYSCLTAARGRTTPHHPVPGRPRRIAGAEGRFRRHTCSTRRSLPRTSIMRRRRSVVETPRARCYGTQMRLRSTSLSPLLPTSRAESTPRQAYTSS